MNSSSVALAGNPRNLDVERRPTSRSACPYSRLVRPELSSKEVLPSAVDLGGRCLSRGFLRVRWRGSTSSRASKNSAAPRSRPGLGDPCARDGLERDEGDRGPVPEARSGRLCADTPKMSESSVSASPGARRQPMLVDRPGQPLPRNGLTRGLPVFPGGVACRDKSSIGCNPRECSLAIHLGQFPCQRLSRPFPLDTCEVAQKVLKISAIDPDFFAPVRRRMRYNQAVIVYKKFKYCRQHVSLPLIPCSVRPWMRRLSFPKGEAPECQKPPSRSTAAVALMSTKLPVLAGLAETVLTIGMTAAGQFRAPGGQPDQGFGATGSPEIPM